MMRFYAILLLLHIATLLLLAACDEMNGAADARRAADRKRQAWEAPCVDVATLLATTAGSPNETACPNKRHRMRVQVATTASNEEIGAVAFCECERGDDAGK